MHPEVLAAAAPVAELQRRRDAVRRGVGSGVILVPGHDVAWRNADNPHPFRQSSHLLYLAPVRRPGMALVMDVEGGVDMLFAPPEDPDAVVWYGPRPSVENEAAAAGIFDVRDIADLPELLRQATRKERTVHLTPQFVPAIRDRVAGWLGADPGAMDERVSEALVATLGELRLRKSEYEVGEIERALTATAAMFDAARSTVRPGIREAEVFASMARAAFARGYSFAFSPIVTVRGEVLHNEGYVNAMEDGDLLLIDAGLETASGYASDISRTMPVSGGFTDVQRALYEIVLEARDEAIAMMRPGVSYRDVHDRASRSVAAGLIGLGLMRGDPDEAVAAGAHALFFVHGVGHPLGLDVHDLHDLGDAVAYPADRPRSRQFGTGFLRFGRTLEEGMVMTVEPGIYFIPALIDRWRAEGRHADFIRYDAVARLRELGGIRLEDDVLVTADGVRVLGPGIPASVEDVEAPVAAR